MEFLQPISKRVLNGGFLLLCLVWIWFSAVPVTDTNSKRISAPQVGFLAPDFTLTSLDGQRVTLSSLKGKVVLINIWASWCPPCKSEMPAIDLVYRKYNNQGLVVLGVDSTIQDSMNNLTDFVDQLKPGFPILLDTQGEVTKAYRVQSLPSSYFIDQNGIIQEIVIGGPMAEALLISRIERLLKGIH